MSQAGREARFLLLIGPAILVGVVLAAMLVSLVQPTSGGSQAQGGCGDVATIEAAFSVPALLAAVGAAEAETLPSDQVVTLAAARSQFEAGALVGFPSALASWGLPRGYPVDRYVAASAALALVLGSEGVDQVLFERRWVVFTAERDGFLIGCADLLSD